MNAEPTGPHGELHDHSLLELFEHHTLAENVRRMLHGLRQPKDSGEYKWARLQFARLSAPAAAVLVPVLVLLVLAFLPQQEAPPRVPIPRLLRPTTVRELEPIQPVKHELPKPPDPLVIEVTPIVMEPLPFAQDAPPTPLVRPEFTDLSAVPLVRSPAVMKGIYPRSPAARERAMLQGSAPKGVDGAVLRALRWLKKEQHADGYWLKHKHAMTGLALLAYLAHGETPDSPEFGQTVERAIRWLIANQDPDGGFPRRYEHAIATYALCEAYGLTGVPMVKYAAEKAVDILIKGQNQTGGWDYGLTSTTRDDTSVMGWCAQALKAADLAGLENEGLAESMSLAIKGFQKNAHPSGGFGYTGPGAGGLTGVGVSCMQLLGAARQAETRLGLLWLDRVTFDWKEPWGTFPIYYWYYITQAKFHASKDVWDDWNRQFAPELIEHQVVLERAGVDGEDIGYWEPPAGKKSHSDGPVMDTTLCTLQLEVYYRNLHTFKEIKQLDKAEDFTSEDDLDIRVNIPGKNSA